MPAKKFLGIDELPAKVLDVLTAVLGFEEVLDGCTQFGLVGLPGERDEVELSGDRLGVLSLWASWAIRPLSTWSLLLTVAPPISLEGLRTQSGPSANDLRWVH